MVVSFIRSANLFFFPSPLLSAIRIPLQPEEKARHTAAADPPSGDDSWQQLAAAAAASAALRHIPMGPRKEKNGKKAWGFWREKGASSFFSCTLVCGPEAFFFSPHSTHVIRAPFLFSDLFYYMCNMIYCTRQPCVHENQDR